MIVIADEVLEKAKKCLVEKAKEWINGICWGACLSLEGEDITESMHTAEFMVSRRTAWIGGQATSQMQSLFFASLATDLRKLGLRVLERLLMLSFCGWQESLLSLPIFLIEMTQRACLKVG